MQQHGRSERANQSGPRVSRRKAGLSTQLRRRLSNMRRHNQSEDRTLDPTPERSLGRCLALSRTLGKVRCVNRRAVTPHRAPHRHTYPVSRSVLPLSLTARGSGCGMRRCCLGAALRADHPFEVNNWPSILGSNQRRIYASKQMELCEGNGECCEHLADKGGEVFIAALVPQSLRRMSSSGRQRPNNFPSRSSTRTFMRS